MPQSQEGLARLVAREGVADWVVDAFRAVDRAAFTPEKTGAAAYADRPVALPEGQTTSQPSLIARMIDELAPPEGGRVLEVGTGYGFQTALLAQRASLVVSVERHVGLASRARANLERAGVVNCVVMVSDGWKGEPGHAPYDGIVVSATASEIPPVLAVQLTEGARLVIPVRDGYDERVVLLEKRAGALEMIKRMVSARFVPLVRE
ncbi:MAG TPA: protein-L-isoaspartate O-methyltransferase [Actinomycetota bacterium]|nr:protein-L-isoaspartate O-methyltransferase [Actinomycetota bacterium]